MWVLGKCPKYFRGEYVEELSNLQRCTTRTSKFQLYLNGEGKYNPKRKSVYQDYTRLSKFPSFASLKQFFTGRRA